MAFSGLIPWTMVRRILVEYMIARKPNIPITVTTEFTANARFLNTLRRRSGASARFSTKTNSARSRAAARNAMTICGLPQPLSEPWITAYSRANRPSAEVICPGQSRERPSGAEELRAMASDRSALTTAMTRTPT